MVAREIDPGIDVNRWLEAAAEKIGDVDGVLGCLTVAMSQEDLEVYELMGIDSEESLAEYLKGLVTQLQVVARNLGHLADHGDLTAVVCDLRKVRSAAS